MMGVGGQMRVKEFNQALGMIARSMKMVNPRATIPKVIKGEAASVLASASEQTNRANQTDINTRYQINSKTKKHNPEGYERKRGKGGRFKKQRPVKGSRVPQNSNIIPFVYLPTKDGKKYYTRNWYPKPIFDKIKKKMAYYKARAKKRTDSAKAVWLVMARKANLFTGRFKRGVSLNKAIAAQGGRYATNSTNNGRQRGMGFMFNVRVDSTNTVLLNKNARGSHAIRSAMARRQKFYETAMQRGGIKTAAQAVRMFPGVYARSLRGAPPPMPQ